MTTSLYVAVNDAPAVEARIHIPTVGIWTVDVRVDRVATISGAATVRLADLELHGTAVLGESYSGAASARVVAGAAGWRKHIPPKFYSHNVGVRITTVIGDAAREVGETVTVAAESIIGTSWTRDAGPASRVLRRLASSWYVKPDGTTYVGPRATGTVTSAFDLVTFDASMGRAIVATEHPADWVPGRTFTAPMLSKAHTIGDVTHIVRGSTVRTEVLVVP